MKKKLPKKKRKFQIKSIPYNSDEDGQYCEFEIPFAAMQWEDDDFDDEAEDILEAIEETVANLQEMPFFFEDHALIDWQEEDPERVEKRNNILSRFKKSGEFKF